MSAHRDTPAGGHGNLDAATVASFGDEWHRYDQTGLPEADLQDAFARYFSVFPWSRLPPGAEGFDMGCGSGRWARLAAPRVGRLHCVDPSQPALDVARRNLAGLGNVDFELAATGTTTLRPGSQDFGYSLGVLHHIPDTAAALRDCARLLKPGAPFLVYLYYDFDNRPWWFRLVWKLSELVRAIVCRLPAALKPWPTTLLAVIVYWPLARWALLLEKLGLNVSNLPLSFYRDKSFYFMRTDSRDRFGTPLERRFSRRAITAMMNEAGLTDVVFRDSEPFWCAVGLRTVGRDGDQA